jgi:Cft2 family RNA processing exonuclease
MFETINYQDLFIELGLDPIAKSGNLVCPFCNKRAFTPYDNGQAHCHACSWHGNAIMLWAEAKRIGRKEAFAELAELYHLKRIKVKKRTRIEALKSLASDLDFLAWARIYFAFYKSERTSAARLQEESGYSRSHFTKVMNGQFDMVSRKAWDAIVLLLRQSIKPDELRKDMGMKSGYWIERIKQDEILRERVSKFQ